ncbi:MAG: hypothetical protein ABR548_05255 [Actinomycetota bacterium]|nr:hypothetical protein [Actinomycetota bacterium]
MSMTLGERKLAKAEFRAMRRRRALALLPGVAVIFWSLADLVAARGARLSALNLGFIRHVLDGVQPIAWTLLLVVVPYLLAVKPRPKRSGAVLALFTGPVLTPILFGSGGWRLWQIGVLAALVLWIEGQDQPRVVRRRPVEVTSADPEYIEEGPSPMSVPEEPSFQSIDGASFQSRSSS